MIIINNLYETIIKTNQDISFNYENNKNSFNFELFYQILLSDKFILKNIKNNYLLFEGLRNYLFYINQISSSQKEKYKNIPNINISSKLDKNVANNYLNEFKNNRMDGYTKGEQWNIKTGIIAFWLQFWLYTQYHLFYFFVKLYITPLSNSENNRTLFIFLLS